MSAGQAAAARRCVLAVAASAQGAIFGQPVGPEAPGYRRVVKRPMDLGTVAAGLQAGGYATTGAGNLLPRTCVALAAMCCAQQDAARPPCYHVLVTVPAGWSGCSTPLGHSQLPSAEGQQLECIQTQVYVSDRSCCCQRWRLMCRVFRCRRGVGGLRAGVGQLPGVQRRGVGPGLGRADCPGSTPEVLAQGQAAAAGRGCRCAMQSQRPCKFAASCTIFSALTIGFSAQHLDVQLRVVTGERVMSAGSAAGTKPNESPPAAGKRGKRSEAAAAEPAASPAATESASPKSARQQGGRRSGASAKTLKDSQKPDGATPQRPAEPNSAPAGSRPAGRRAVATPQGDRGTPTPDATRAAALGLQVKRQRIAAPSPEAADAKQPNAAVQQQEQPADSASSPAGRKSGNRRGGGRADTAAAAEQAEPRHTPAAEDAMPRRRSGRR